MCHVPLSVDFDGSGGGARDIEFVYVHKRRYVEAHFHASVYTLATIGNTNTQLYPQYISRTVSA